MPLRLPPLAPLRLFEAAARHQSFKRAADELNLTPSAVSHGIVSLERWLGVDLFQRGAARGVTLSPAGMQYLPYVTEAIAMIAIGTQRLPGRSSDRRVVLSVAPTFAARWLLPNLGKFRHGHPGIDIVLSTAHQQAAFPMDGVDLAIRMGQAASPGTTSRLLIRERIVPVASPGYLAKVAPGGTPDWARVTFLQVTSVEQDWQAWINASGASIEVRSGLSFDNVQFATDAAAAGLGIAIGRLPLNDPDLDSGRLVRACEPEVPVATGYWLVGMPGEETRSEIRAFTQWLMSEFSPQADLSPNAQGKGRP
jgi:LysR family glycine cleavage system transcriptional activator